MDQDLIFPDYNGKSLLNIPSTIFKLFNIPPLKQTMPDEYIKNLQGVEKIILFVFDGLGHNLYQKEGIKHKFFSNLTQKGFYSPITTIFPATTAAALTTLNSGLSSYEHGLPEWNVYFRELDCVIQTLPFLPVTPEDLIRLNNPPEGLLFNQKTIYQYFSEANIPSYIFLHYTYSNSLYNQTASLGSDKVFSYKGIADYMVMLRKLVEEVSGPAYFYAYWSGVDSYEHMFGPSSDEVKAEMRLVSHMIQEEFVDKIRQKDGEKIGVILTADHGQIETDPYTTIYLDDFEEITESFKISHNGRAILPSGSARDIFLHIKEDKLDFVISFLNNELKGKVRAFKMQEDFVDKGVFGSGQMHPEFLNRVGNVLILPEKNNTAWYRFLPEHRLEFRGLHGGMSEDEMLIPFASARLSDLIQ
jgi:predicted AlkP superfamily pyrophosphatase or phosphodiesterase